MSSPLRIDTPAKINLTLAVRGRRPDGFHEIESWIVPIALFDTLTFVPSDAWELRVSPPIPSVTVDETNLVTRAARMLSEAAAVLCRANVTLIKRIPVGSGLGGGSSDAAATLRGLNDLWQLHWPLERLAPLAAALGSDVPLFLDAHPVVVRGRGEMIEPVASSCWRGWVALVVPTFSLSTVDVYRKFTEMKEPLSAHSQPWCDPLTDSESLCSVLFNDLEPAAFAIEPRLRILHAKLDSIDGHRVRMTGSGSCLFTIFDTQVDADRWAIKARPALADSGRIEVVAAQ